VYVSFFATCHKTFVPLFICLIVTVFKIFIFYFFFHPFYSTLLRLYMLGILYFVLTLPFYFLHDSARLVCTNMVEHIHLYLYKLFRLHNVFISTVWSADFDGSCGL
jgi:hypothetical protein